MQQQKRRGVRGNQRKATSLSLSLWYIRCRCVPIPLYPLQCVCVRERLRENTCIHKHALTHMGNSGLKTWTIIDTVECRHGPKGTENNEKLIRYKLRLSLAFGFSSLLIYSLNKCKRKGFVIPVQCLSDFSVVLPG